MKTRKGIVAATSQGSSQKQNCRAVEEQENSLEAIKSEIWRTSQEVGDRGAADASLGLEGSLKAKTSFFGVQALGL